ncbi:MAG: PIN/TRAM domain-containing protein [Bryobacteraceae bacterium]
MPGGLIVSALGLALLVRPLGPNLLYSVLAAIVLVAVCLLCDRQLKRGRPVRLAAGSIGLLIGLCLGALLAALFSPAFPFGLSTFFRFFAPLATGFLGLSVALAHAGSFYLPFASNSTLATAAPLVPNTIRYVDTSALIDGRIADIVDAGFLDGLIVIPEFVLNELQAVADTADALRRNRGRRGLDLVARLQKSSSIRVEISPVDFPDMREVDRKLIEAAKDSRAQIVTTDYNLSKLAQVRGLQVLNVNELATALRPVVLQGETIRVFIAKEGKEHNQGLAYLEDGTMVVVDGAKRQIGKTVDVLVTGVVQCAAGKMIFARYEEARSPAAGLRTSVSEGRSSQPS